MTTVALLKRQSGYRPLSTAQSSVEFGIVETDKVRCDDEKLPPLGDLPVHLDELNKYEQVKLGAVTLLLILTIVVT